MDEKELRSILHSAGADPGPKDSWQTFLQVAHRRRRVHQAAMGAVVALTAIAAAGAWAVTTRVSLDDDPKPAHEDERREERTLEDDVDRIERRIRKTEEVVDAALPVGPSRRGGGKFAAPPGGGEADVETPPRDDSRDPGGSGRRR